MEIKKILIIRNGAIGDVVHTSGLFRAIKKAYPQIDIDYATSYVTAQLLKDDRDLNEVFVFEDYTYKYFWSLVPIIKSKNYDLIINLQPQLKFNLLCSMTGVKTVKYKKDFTKHAVENFFDTAKKIFPEMQLSDELELTNYENHKLFLMQKCKELALRKNVVFNMSATPQRQGRKWKVDYFKELALRLINEYDCNIILTGSVEDKELTSQLVNLHDNIYDYAGKYTLSENAAIYSMCDLFISGDTGPLHIASACKNPICIGMYGSMPISRTGVWGNNHYSISASDKMNCVPCNRRICKLKNAQYNPCMDALKPEVIFNLISDEHMLG
ncbi:glycosyltransferase family 9 protein [bacterium]|nr:glycosyltransferase family 9 protein [bacterium]